MTSPSHPLSYTTYPLPQLKLQHHPPDSPVPTPVIQILLDRTTHKNAFTNTMKTSLVTALDLLSSDPRVRAIVLSSADPDNRFFCAGMDLEDPEEAAGRGGGKVERGAKKEVEDEDEAALNLRRHAHRDGGAEVSLAILRCAKPVIAAINGHAVGVGITMTLPCNVRIVSQEAKVGFVFSRRGINMEACSSFFLPRHLGPGRALTLLTTGATYAPSNPLVSDLFAEIVPDPADVVPRALELASEIAASTSAVATRAMKDMLYRGPPASAEEAERLESLVFFDLFRGRDAREGMRSFLEKRTPRFEGAWEVDRPAVWPWWEKKGVLDGKYLGEGTGGWLGWLRSKI